LVPYIDNASDITLHPMSATQQSFVHYLAASITVVLQWLLVGTPVSLMG